MSCVLYSNSVRRKNVLKVRSKQCSFFKGFVIFFCVFVFYFFWILNILNYNSVISRTFLNVLKCPIFRNRTFFH